MRVDLPQLLLLCRGWWFLGREKEVLAEVRRVHEHVGHLMHFLQVATEGSLLRFIAQGHLNKLAVDLLVPAVLLVQSFPADQLYLLPGSFSELGLQFLALLGVDGLVLECDLGVRVDGDALEGLPPQQGLQRLLLHYLKWEKGQQGKKGDG